MNQGKHFIDGKWVGGTGDLFSSHNPIDNELLWQGESATELEVANAVLSAQDAFKQWSMTAFSDRQHYIEQFAEQLTAKQNTLAKCIAKETGKPLWESKQEINAMIAKAAISIRAYQQRTGETYDASNPVRITKLQHRPHGVMAVFGPFNFPGHLPNGHIIPALLAGNTVIFKPSELTPWVAEEIMACWDAINLPPGVINLLQGKQTTGALLASHPKINGILFTGSYQTGRKIHQAMAGYPEKLLALEMGGNNALIVWDVADLVAAAYTTIQSSFITAGQRCVCARRVFIANSAAGNQFVDALVAMTKNLKFGAYTQQPEPFMGPVISAQAAQKLLQQQQALLQDGGKTLLPMQRNASSPTLLSPGIIDSTHISDPSDEEIFGPLLQIIRVKHFEQAIHYANQTKFGLAAGLLSDDKQRFDMFYPRINAGIINWNCQLTGASSDAPFGGIKCSGNHRPSAYYAADYCAYPAATLMAEKLCLPATLTPGIAVKHN